MSSPDFFKDEPREGDPLAKKGIAEGLRRLQHAFRYMSVHNGHVDWHGFEPKIVVDAAGSGSGLPDGGTQYQVLQRNGDGEAVWDWVRAH